MSHLFAVLIAFVFALPAVRAGDAVAKAVFGRVDVPKEEAPVSSFSVFTTLMVARNQCDKLPVVFFQSLPVYPSSVLRASVVGEATVSFVISEQGVVGDIKVERATVE
ncbi:MAG TPA: hypothetical protein PKD68_05455, partial [Candidatus Saccharibacteria bacterium]|nr:hypothetical protein [Candidatus Saccharibacteria bacterium]